MDWSISSCGRFLTLRMDGELVYMSTAHTNPHDLADEIRYFRNRGDINKRRAQQLGRQLPIHVRGDLA